MNVEIPAGLGRFVEQLIADGVVASEHDALVEGLRLLRARERLRHDVNSAVEQLDRGESVDGKEEFRRLGQCIDEAVG